MNAWLDAAPKFAFAAKAVANVSAATLKAFSETDLRKIVGSLS